MLANVDLDAIDNGWNSPHLKDKDKWGFRWRFKGLLTIWDPIQYKDDILPV